MRFSQPALYIFKTAEAKKGNGNSTQSKRVPTTAATWILFFHIPLDVLGLTTFTLFFFVPVDR